MSAIEVTPPFPLFTDSTGEPLEAGYIYIGVANTDPVNNPISVYWDVDLTIPASQPIRTINGYPSRSGTPANIYANSDYSITVKDKNGIFVYYSGSASRTADGLREELADASNVALGDALYAVKQPFTGASARTGHQKNQDILTSADFPDLATAVSGIGSTKTTLHINSSVTVAADLTIPSNVNVVVEGEGLITVNSGIRLFINGPFSAPRLQKVFASSLHTVTFTGSVNGNVLDVTAVASGTISLGQIANISGVEPGTTLGGLFSGTGGVGTYYLSNFAGIIASAGFTLTGASVVFGAGTVSEVFPQWFGAIADDGTTDNANAFQQAALSMPWGGKVKIPAGKYKVLSTTVLHGGVDIEGEGHADRWAGSPPNDASRQTYIWLGTSSTSVFTIGSGMSSCRVSNLSLAPSSTPGSTPPAASKVGIQLSGHYPGFIWDGIIERCWFYNLDYGISVNDSWAGNATYWDGAANVTYYDWSVAPFTVRNCRFSQAKAGIYFNTNNADSWAIESCNFFIPSASDGIKCVRSGYFCVRDSFGGGSSASTNSFLHVVSTGSGPVDSIKLDRCQCETLAHFVHIDSAGSTDITRTLTLQDCIWQMSADVTIGLSWQLVSQNSFVGEPIYGTAAGVLVNSICDQFTSGKHIIFSGAGVDPTSYINTYIPGTSPDSFIGYGAGGSIIEGRSTFNGTAAPAGGTWKTGDRCTRNPPVVGQPKAWTCTVAGSPGTWVSEGNL